MQYPAMQELRDYLIAIAIDEPALEQSASLLRYTAGCGVPSLVVVYGRQLLGDEWAETRGTELLVRWLEVA